MEAKHLWRLETKNLESRNRTARSEKSLKTGPQKPSETKLMFVVLGVIFWLEICSWNCTKIMFKTNLGDFFVLSRRSMKRHHVTISSSWKLRAKVAKSCMDFFKRQWIYIKKKKTLVLGRKPFQQVTTTWNRRVGCKCHDMLKSTGWDLKNGMIELMFFSTHS